jgi:hypothetical protein
VIEIRQVHGRQQFHCHALSRELLFTKYYLEEREVELVGRRNLMQLNSAHLAGLMEDHRNEPACQMHEDNEDEDNDDRPVNRRLSRFVSVREPPTIKPVISEEVGSRSSMVEMSEDFLQLINNPDQALAEEMRMKWFPPFDSDPVSSAGYTNEILCDVLKSLKSGEPRHRIEARIQEAMHKSEPPSIDFQQAPSANLVHRNSITIKQFRRQYTNRDPENYQQTRKMESKKTTKEKTKKQKGKKKCDPTYRPKNEESDDGDDGDDDGDDADNDGGYENDWFDVWEEHHGKDKSDVKSDHEVTSGMPGLFVEAQATPEVQQPLRTLEEICSLFDLGPMPKDPTPKDPTPKDPTPKQIPSQSDWDYEDLLFSRPTQPKIAIPKPFPTTTSQDKGNSKAKPVKSETREKVVGITNSAVSSANLVTETDERRINYN